MSPRWREYTESGFRKIDRDYRFLLDCAQEVFDELGENDLARVFRAMAGGDGELADMQHLPPRGAQAISIAFQLLNMVEENAANQTMRAREADGGLMAEPGLWGAGLKALLDAGYPADAILDRIEATEVEPVLTSHPTEAKRWTVLDQHRALYLSLVELENQMYTPAERNQMRSEIKAGLERLWRTGEILLKKPEVASERRNALYYFRVKFPDVLRLADQRFMMCWEAAGLDPSLPRARKAYPRLRFGSWVGGDRDGHPLVTADVTRDTLHELHRNAVELIAGELQRLEELLGLSIYGQTPSGELRLRTAALLAERGRDAGQASGHEEPWRLYIGLLRERLPLPGNAAPSYRMPSELLADLAILERSLHTIGASRIAEANLLPVQRIVDTFGFHLATVDIRQNSAFHDLAIAQMLEAAGIPDGAEFPRWPEDRRLAFLDTELQSPRPFLAPGTDAGPNARDVLDCHRLLACHIAGHGRAGVGGLIVSMTRQLSDLLCVYIFCREAGLFRQAPGGPVCLLPIVPLFETIEDLHASPGILRGFLAHPLTRRSLPWLDRTLDEMVARPGPLDPLAGASPRPIQQVMLGYSDSNKDSGILSSLCALRQAQQELLEVAAEARVGVRFFHGRGGTISRGAGPTHRFLEALPPHSLDTGIRLTEQGETIAQKYTNRKTAVTNLELLTAGTVVDGLLAPHRGEPEGLAEINEALSALSRDEYQALLRADGFLTFHRQATPIDALENSRIGSRPSRRTGRATLADLRAIPWVFSWTQSRFYLPGWYGVGTALERLEREHPPLFDNLCRQVRQRAFLRYVLNNVETNHASADTSLMADYAALVDDAALRHSVFGQILSEFERTGAMLCKIFGGDLQERRPRFYKTLHARDEGLRLLHTEQIRLLREWRHATANDDDTQAGELLPLLLLSVNAIASGLRTTG